MAAGGIIAVIGALVQFIWMAIFSFVCIDHLLCEYQRSKLIWIFDGKAYITNLKEGFSYVKSHEVCYF